jgi:hypothetical protein
VMPTSSRQRMFLLPKAVLYIVSLGIFLFESFHGIVRGLLFSQYPVPAPVVRLNRFVCWLLSSLLSYEVVALAGTPISHDGITERERLNAIEQ